MLFGPRNCHQKYLDMDKQTTEPKIAKDAVLVTSSKLPDDTPQVHGYDWNNGINYEQLLNSYVNSGFQATNFGKAVNEINKMVNNTHEFFFFIFRTNLNSIHFCSIVGLSWNCDANRRYWLLWRWRIYKTKIKLYDIFGFHIEHCVVRCAREHTIFGSTQHGI